jgi:hypothetical protein
VPAVAERVGPFQERSVWLDRQARAENRNRADNITVAYELTGEIDQRLLSRALGDVVERHLPLRTVYPGDADPPVAVVLPARYRSPGCVRPPRPRHMPK